jgi:hypothetical protein
MKPIAPINLDCIEEKEYLSSEFQITPSSESNGLFIYETSDPKIFTVNQEGIVTITGPGSAYINIQQLESANFGANQINRIINVKKSKPPIDVSGPQVISTNTSSVQAFNLKIKTIPNLIKEVLLLNPNILELRQISQEEYQLIPKNPGKTSIIVYTKETYYFTSNSIRYDIEVVENLKNLPIVLNINTFNKEFKHNGLKEIDILTSNDFSTPDNNNVQIAFQQQTPGYNYDIGILNLQANKFINNIQNYDREILCFNDQYLNFSIQWNLGNNIIYDFSPYLNNISSIPRINIFRSDNKYIDFAPIGRSFLKIPPNSLPSDPGSFFYNKLENTNSGIKQFKIPDLTNQNLYYTINFSTRSDLTLSSLTPPSGLWNITNGVPGEIKYEYLLKDNFEKNIVIEFTPLTVNTPNNLVISEITEKSFRVSWPGVPNSTKYAIDVSTSPNFIGFVDGYNNLIVNNPLLIVTGLEAGITYYVRVRSININLVSQNSLTLSQCTKPNPPKDIKLTSADNFIDGNFNIVWSPVIGASLYEIDIATTSDFTSGLLPMRQSIDNYININNLNLGTIYYFRIRAVNNLTQNVVKSNNSTTEASFVNTITNLRVTNRTQEDITISWDSVPGANYYQVNVLSDCCAFGGFPLQEFFTAGTSLIFKDSLRTDFCGQVIFKVKADNTNFTRVLRSTRIPPNPPSLEINSSNNVVQLKYIITEEIEKRRATGWRGFRAENQGFPASSGPPVPVDSTSLGGYGVNLRIASGIDFSNLVPLSRYQGDLSIRNNGTVVNVEGIRKGTYDVLPSREYYVKIGLTCNNVFGPSGDIYSFITPPPAPRFLNLISSLDDEFRGIEVSIEDLGSLVTGYRLSFLPNSVSPPMNITGNSIQISLPSTNQGVYIWADVQSLFSGNTSSNKVISNTTAYLRPESPPHSIILNNSSLALSWLTPFFTTESELSIRRWDFRTSDAYLTELYGRPPTPAERSAAMVESMRLRRVASRYWWASDNLVIYSVASPAVGGLSLFPYVVTLSQFPGGDEHVANPTDLDLIKTTTFSAAENIFVFSSVPYSQGQTWYSKLFDRGGPGTCYSSRSSIGPIQTFNSSFIDKSIGDTLENSSFPKNIIEYQRNSIGSYFAGDGTLRYADINKPILDFNPPTDKRKGLLIRRPTTNHYLHSSDLSLGTLTRAFAELTDPSNPNESSPEGIFFSSVYFREDTSTLDTHVLSRNSTALSPSADVTASVFVKFSSVRGSAPRRIRLVLWDSSAANNSVGATFDIINGTISNVANSGNGTGASAQIQNIGNGWYRCSVSGKPNTSGTAAGLGLYLDNGTTTVYTGDGQSGLLVWGAQLEEGLIANNYVPTTTSVVPYASEIITVNSFSNYINPLESTLLAEIEFRAILTTARYIQIDDGSNSNRLVLGTTSAGSFQNFASVNGFTNLSTTITPGIVPNTVYRIAVAFAANNSRSAVNGVLSSPGTAGSMPQGLNRLRLDGQLGSNQRNHWLRRFIYYPSRLSDSDLQAITNPNLII